jgi:NarL family two-component system response regulator YdfI
MIGAPIRVVVVDDHGVIRMGLRTLLDEGGDDFQLVGEAADGLTALRLIADLQPDVVLMDVRMPGMDGIAAVERIRRDWPRVAVLILTTYDEDDVLIRGLQAGAYGYLLKDCDLEVLLNAIRTAARHELLVQPAVMERILGHAARAAQPASAPGTQPAHRRHPLDLTDREREVLQRVARGERSKEIAAGLGITERTVGAHITSMYAKLGVDSRAAAVAVAIERGILQRRG